MAKTLGQPMIVENKAGAGTSIGAAFVSREAPDGYTILMATNSTLVTNRYLYKELPYDPDGFARIGMVGVGPLVLLSSPKRPFNNTQDLVAYAKQNPGKLTFATFGPGTSSHLAGELFKRAGIDILHVPFWLAQTQACPPSSAATWTCSSTWWPPACRKPTRARARCSPSPAPTAWPRSPSWKRCPSRAIPHAT